MKQEIPKPKDDVPMKVNNYFVTIPSNIHSTHEEVSDDRFKLTWVFYYWFYLLPPFPSHYEIEEDQRAIQIEYNSESSPLETQKCHFRKWGKIIE